jgi:hypothetical protein
VSRSADDQAAPVEQRALVPVPEIECSERPSLFSRRPPAPYLAHLIATARGEPQTCERRRAAPDKAAQAYAAASQLGGTISRKS